ncbi:MAG: AAA family ATPase, partial [Lachnospiraceae bacterium]|nr:AAA family ATPase [Lachnospiraceae bacterium]
MKKQLDRIQELECLIAKLPQGNITYKTINGKKQPYLQWTENGKSKSKYIKIAEREIVMEQVSLRRALQEELKILKAEASSFVSKATEVSFETNVVSGRDLYAMTEGIRDWEKRDCFEQLQKYINGAGYDRVCLVYGLRRTGKTTMLRQALYEMSEEQLGKAVYIKARSADTMAAMNRDLKKLQELGYKYIFIDEVTLMQDFIDSAALFSDIYAAMGMKIVLSGTDSLGFWFTLRQELYDRAVTIHTTFIPFREHSRILGIDSIDEYIRYGGTLRAGELAFDDDDVNADDASFRDDETTRRYIDTAICKNIQHSLDCCKDGQYYRHLQSLYDAGELTNAINRVIEDMTHRFVLRTFNKSFKSHDLGSTAQLLRKETDPMRKSDILDRVNTDDITERLMELLDIRNQENLSIGITKAHIAEIKEYLMALDLIVGSPVETSVAAEPLEGILFTQPGMRYCQAQALVHSLKKDSVFAELSETEKNMVCERILEEVRGRMMEEIVLLETTKAMEKDRRIFKMTFAGAEFDMVIFSDKTNSCECYEIKHSDQIAEHQMQYLTDEECLKAVEWRFGPITKRCVIYRGPDAVLENGIVYRNVEEYL